MAAGVWLNDVHGFDEEGADEGQNEHEVLEFHSDSENEASCRDEEQ